MAWSENVVLKKNAFLMVYHHVPHWNCHNSGKKPRFHGQISTKHATPDRDDPDRKVVNGRATGTFFLLEVPIPYIRPKKKAYISQKYGTFT